MIDRALLIVRMTRRRRRGRVVPPVLSPEGHRYPITTPYGISGPWAAGRHTGEDHACPVGSWALATSWGSVVYVGSRGWGPAYGLQVRILTGDGRWEYSLCHLSRALVRVGDQVKPGQVVGYTGDTGNSTGPHLHLEARPRGGAYGSDLNPLTIKRKERR